MKEIYLNNQKLPVASRALFASSAPEAVANAIRTPEMRYLVNNVPLEAAAQVTNELSTNTTHAVTKGLKVADLKTLAKVGAAGLVGIGLPVVLSILEGNAQQAEFDKINEKLDTLQNDINKINVTVTRTSIAVDQSTLDNAIRNMQLDGPLGLDAQVTAYNEYIALAQSSEATHDPEILQSYLIQFENNAKELKGIISSMEDEFQGQGGRTSLMAAYAQVAMDTSPTTPYLTSSNEETSPTTTPLTSSYNQFLANVYAYWKGEETIAVDLQVNYELALGHATGSSIFFDEANNAAQNLAKNELLDASTLPKPIPSYAVFDPRTGYLWSRFQTASMSPYIAQYNFAEFVSGDEAKGQYLYNNTAEGKKLYDVGLKAFNDQKKENLQLGLEKFFKWSLPYRSQLATISVAGTLSGATSQDISNYLTSRGFPKGVVPYQVWTTDQKVEHVPSNTYSGTLAHDVTFSWSMVPGNNADTGWWRDHKYYPTEKLNTGIQALYFDYVGTTYANAQPYAYSDFPAYQTPSAK